MSHLLLLHCIWDNSLMLYLACRAASLLLVFLNSSTFPACRIMAISRLRISFTTVCHSGRSRHRTMSGRAATTTSLSPARGCRPSLCPPRSLLPCGTRRPRPTQPAPSTHCLAPTHGQLPSLQCHPLRGTLVADPSPDSEGERVSRRLLVYRFIIVYNSIKHALLSLSPLALHLILEDGLRQEAVIVL